MDIECSICIGIWVRSQQVQEEDVTYVMPYLLSPNETIERKRAQTTNSYSERLQYMVWQQLSYLIGLNISCTTLRPRMCNS